MNKVEAYFTGWCSPALTWGSEDKRPFMTVQVKFEDGCWQTIRKVYCDIGQRKDIAAFEILRHFLRGLPAPNEVKALVEMPASSLCRVRPKHLEIFRQGGLF